jgi:hypothetical protein
MAMPRYVILEHDYPERHWDFMLEAEEVLRTWKLVAFPEPEQAIAATASFDHRLLYLDYEGPISGGRGCFVRRDRGCFTWLVDEPETVQVRLDGERLRGRVVLTRTADNQWSLTFSSSAE